MSARRNRNNVCSAPAVLAVFCLFALLCLMPGQAQIITPLLQFTNVWKYDQSGQELGTAWRTNDYDDSSWSSGPGLLGAEPDTPTVYTIHAPIGTPLTISSTVTTFYFRTTFELTGSTNGLSLIASNLVDDGLVIHLNGVDVGHLRVPANQRAVTQSGGPPVEGTIEPMTLTNVLTALRVGNNVLAVEVHNSVSGSYDVMFGLKLMAIQALPLVITNQPQSQTVIVGDAVTLSAGVSGSPAFYRWQKDGVNIANATNSSYLLSPVQLANAGNYRVIITNSISAVTSSVAALTVFVDLTGPTLLAAIGNNPVAGGSFPSNTINVLFSEALNLNIAQNSDNYVVTRFGMTHRIPILRSIYGPSFGILLTLDTSDPDWSYGGDYVLTVNNLKDLRGNVIAPNSQVAVSWPLTTNVSLFWNTWSFHTSATFDSDVYEQPWQTANYVEGSWWARGQGLFRGGPVLLTPCFGDFNTETGYQPEPSLFRTTFLWPTNWPTSIGLRVTTIFNDGLVLYLNGAEIFRTNTLPGSISALTRAGSMMTFCTTNLLITVTNLLPGTNWLAAAVTQTSTLGGDSIFGLQNIRATAVFARSLPEAPPPSLNAEVGTNSLRLYWSGGGYALEGATNLSLGSASYPLGPWQQVTNMSNPYTNGLDGMQRFFRLKK